MVLVLIADAPPLYSSKTQPPDVERRTLNRLAPKVPGPRKLGRSWVVDRTNGSWLAEKGSGAIVGALSLAASKDPRALRACVEALGAALGVLLPEGEDEGSAMESGMDRPLAT